MAFKLQFVNYSQNLKVLPKVLGAAVQLSVELLALQLTEDCHDGDTVSKVGASLWVAMIRNNTAGVYPGIGTDNNVGCDGRWQERGEVTEQ